MTLRDPLWLENAGAVYNATEYRQWLRSMTAAREGVMGTTDFKVLAKSVPSMHLDVSAGGIVILGDQDAEQGTYYLHNDAPVDIGPLAPADGTFHRYDLVFAAAYDTEYGDGDDGGDFIIVTGTPGASPAFPVQPDVGASMLIAAIDVPNGATSITNANILDMRLRYDRAVVARLFSASTQTLTSNAFTRVEGWTALEDPFGFLDGAVGIEVPATLGGLFQLEAGVRFADGPNALSQRDLRAVTSNHGTQRFGFTPPASTGTGIVTGSKMLRLDDAETLELHTRQISGGDLDLAGNSEGLHYLQLLRLGA